MKIWIKLLIGTILGIVLGTYLPVDGNGAREILALLSEIIINIGRYILYPLVFFSLAIGTYKLKQGKKTIRVILRSLFYLIFFSALFAVVGTLSVLILSPARIPIIVEVGNPLRIPGIVETVSLMFPRNLFQVFNDSGSFLLPLGFLGFLIGINLSFDNMETRPLRELLDALSRVFYHINDLLVEVMGIGLIALAGYLMIILRSTPSLELFTQLLIVLAVDAVVITFGVIPAIIYLFSSKRKNPYRKLYGLTGAALAALVSGDSYFTLPFLAKCGYANLGVPRRVGSFTYPLFALFGKAGTALVTGVAFVVILKSYSSLGITLGGILWVMAHAFLLSFLTGSYPALGFLAAISFACGLYGQGLEEGFLILTPVLPLLSRAGVFLDTLAAGTTSLLVAEQEELNREVEMENYV
jgi:Na+/H+-dicarboxylate symporter